jgi:uncharacterized protein YeaO (DUF488 family)
MTIFIKRIYSEASEQDGIRILVDRLWPRGIKKQAAKIDLWVKEITPSDELRKWFHADVAQHWDEFQMKYRQELESQSEQLNQLKTLAEHQDITLLTAAKDEQRNHAVVLKKLLETNKAS